MSIESKLTKLEKKALSQGRYALAAAIVHALADISDINRQINIVGALHEVGYLQNSLSSYWKEFRTNEAAWIEICLSRLISADYDYWALAALLGCNGPNTIETLLGKGFKSAALRFYQRFDKPDVHVNTLYLNSDGKVLRPIFEIGYDSKDFSIIDAGRARALSLKNDAWSPGEFVGNGWLSLSMQAKLPHGSWRTVSTFFEMKKEWLVQNAA